MSSTTSSSAAATSSQASDGGSNGGGNGGPSSPLLFFVALGFGVVFTNLWIIVGVKYCFRYNQRNRARLAGEDPDAVDLNAMPRQRRRREKKLMTIDEVNEKFPLIKYKTWRSTRADQGLPTAGGITNAGSRPASIRDIPRKSHDAESRELEPKTPTTSTINEKFSTPEHGRPEQIEEESATSNQQSTVTKSAIVTPEPALVRQNTDGEEQEVDDGDRIQHAIPAEHLPDPGDTCAICIDTIEEEDDIRGLSCGHAFHASCVDPWLTSRRACCPLCKADYYMPKPRPEGTQEEPRRSVRTEQIGPSQFFMSGRAGQRRGRQRGLYIPGVFSAHQRAQQRTPENARSNRRNRRASSVPETSPEIDNQEQNSTSWRQRLSSVRMPAIPSLSRIRRGRGNEAGEQPPVTSEVSPAVLEAGSQPR